MGQHFPMTPRAITPIPRSHVPPKVAGWTTEVLGQWECLAGEIHQIERHEFCGPEATSDSPKLAIFGGIHGDEPASVHALYDLQIILGKERSLAHGLIVHAYPICNPTGFRDGTRHARSGLDLNREFWRNSPEPEIALLEKELSTQDYDGLIALHADDTSDGVYGYARGAFFTKDLLKPALQAASEAIPVNQLSIIDGFHAVEGIIHSAYDGILSIPPGHHKEPFEIILESPAKAPLIMQRAALVLGLREILTTYRSFISHAADI